LLLIGGTDGETRRLRNGTAS